MAGDPHTVHALLSSIQAMEEFAKALNDDDLIDSNLRATGDDLFNVIAAARVTLKSMAAEMGITD